MNQKELTIVIESHKKWINGKGGERANLQEANLQEANLQGANLQEADLRRANLREANLQGADLRRANLFGANLRRANLREANLQGADLQRANLFGANLREANLDFSALPLWCGSFGMKVDWNIFSQILYHLCRLDCDDERAQKVIALVREHANDAPVRERHGLPEVDAEVGE